MKIRRLFANFASLAVLRLTMAGLTFASFWILSRRLSAADLGGFSLLMNGFFLVQAMPLLGMTMPLMRRVASQPGNIGMETSNSFFFALPVAAAISVLLVIAGYWYADQGLFWPFALLGVSLLPTAWIVVAECVLVGHECTYAVACISALEALGRFLGAWAAVSTGRGLIGVFEIFALLRFAAAGAYLVNRNLPAPRWAQVQSQILQAYRREVPTYFSIALVTALCSRIDIIILSKLLSLRDAGIYAAAARLSDAALMVPTMAAIVIFPSQARLFESDRAEFARMLTRVLRGCLIAGFVAALMVIALSPSLIRLIYAPRLSPAGPILQILIVGATVMVSDQLLSTTMMAAKAQHADLRAMSIGLAVLTACLFLLTHFFGLRGAAMAAPVSVLVRVLYRARWAETSLGSPLLFGILRIVLAACVGIGTFVAAAADSLSAAWLCGLVAYGFALCVTRAVQAKDWRALRQLLLQRRRLQA